MLRLALLSLPAAVVWAATVSGTVWLHDGKTPRPISSAHVLARSADGRDLLQTAETDSQGRYVLQNLPEKRVVLSAASPGYFGRAVAGGEPELVLDLSSDNTLERADFELFPGGVITGRITDALGEPLENVEVRCWRIIHAGGRHQALAPGAVTDDRGVYRVFGLEPGNYILLARPPFRRKPPLAASYFFPGTAQESNAKEIEVGPGEEVTGIDLTLGDQPGYTISGKIAGADPGQIKDATIFAIPISDESAAAARSPNPEELNWAIGIRMMNGGVSRVDERGDFLLSGLPAGEYVLVVSARPGSVPAGMRAPITTIVRQAVDVRGNMTGLLLHAARVARISGRVLFRKTQAGRARPEAVILQIVDRNPVVLGTRSRETAARSPDYRFEFPDLLPGSYTLRMVSPPGGFLVLEGEPSEAKEIAVPEGAALHVELEAGFGAASLSGIVKQPGSGAPLPEARVALSKAPRGSGTGDAPLQLRSVQADQHGRWSIPDLLPGAYRICAWRSASVESLYAPETWQAAGAAVKKIVVDPNTQVDVELTSSDVPAAGRRPQTASSGASAASPGGP